MKTMYRIILFITLLSCVTHAKVYIGKVEDIQDDESQQQMTDDKNIEINFANDDDDDNGVELDDIEINLADLIKIKEKNSDDVDDDDDDDEEEFESRDVTQKDPWGIRFPRIRFPPVFHSRRRCAHVLKPKPTGHCKTESNGCGGKGSKVPVPFQNALEPACTKHDVCYYCGRHYHWNRHVCDYRMMSDMLQICDCKYNTLLAQPTRTVCRSAVDVYFASVTAGGWMYYSDKSPSWCHNHCVIPRGNPFTSVKK